MGTLGEEPDVNTVKEAALQGDDRTSSLRRVPCHDATGRVLPITPEEQARNAQAIAELVEACWPCPMRTHLAMGRGDARSSTRSPHRKLFEGLY